MSSVLYSAELHRGVARIFQRGGGGVTRCQNEVTLQIFMSFLPPVVGCLLKTWLTKGGGGFTGFPGPPWLRPCYTHQEFYLIVLISFTNVVATCSVIYVRCLKK